MTLIQSLGSVLIVAAAVSDYFNTMFTTRKVFRAHGYEAIFLKSYTGLSRTMWIVGFSLLLYGQIYTLLHHKRIGVTVISTYIVAGIGSILLLVAGTLRRNTVSGGGVFLDSGNIINETFRFDDRIITYIFAVMLSGSVFFIAHAIMFFFFLYNEAISANEEKELSHEEQMEEGQNPNSSLDINQEDKDEVRKA